MAGSSNTLHEREELLSELTRDLHRALVSIQEELEAVDWYRQRAEGCSDPELREILLHNMREEVEHATMLLEWVRRRDSHVDATLRTYLFTTVPITGIEEASAEQPLGSAPSRPPLTVGKAKGGLS